jgi:hypothetical protein
MVQSYYTQRVRIWLNHTLGRRSAAANTALRSDSKDIPGFTPAVTTTKMSTDGIASTIYDHWAHTDCVGGDLDLHDCTGNGEQACLAQLQRLCTAASECIGFTYPQCLLKTDCGDFRTSATVSTVYVKHGEGPVNTTGFRRMAGHNCKGDTLKQHVCGDKSEQQCVAELGQVCNMTKGCVGFSYPSAQLKSACSNFVGASPATVIYLRGNYKGPTYGCEAVDANHSRWVHVCNLLVACMWSLGRRASCTSTHPSSYMQVRGGKQ